MAVERQTAMDVEQSEVRQDVVDYLKEQLVYDQESEKKSLVTSKSTFDS